MERNSVQKIEPPTTAYQNRCTKISITSDHNHSPFNQAAITRTTTSLVAKRLHIQTVNLVGLEPPVVFRPNDFILETGQTAGNCAVQAPRESFEALSTIHASAWVSRCVRHRSSFVAGPGVPFRERVLVSWNAAGRGSRISYRAWRRT